MYTHTHSATYSEVPCMCLRFWENLLIGGLTNGQIVIYNSDSGAKAIEITAHARSINALDVAQDSGLVRYNKLLIVKVCHFIYLRQFQIFLTSLTTKPKIALILVPPPPKWYNYKEGK